HVNSPRNCVSYPLSALLRHTSSRKLEHLMNPENPSRRQFLQSTALAAGAMALASTGHQVALANAPAAPAVAAPVAAAAAKRTATDLVDLGKTGLKCTRLGLGLGSNNGQVQLAAGAEAFNKLIKHAFYNGITMLDTAESY